MVPFDRTNSDNELGENPAKPAQTDQDVRDLYRSVIDRMQPSVLETVFAGSWFTGDGIADSYDARRRDFHPTPLEHVRYIDAVAPDLANAQNRSWMADCEHLARQDRLAWHQPNRPQGRL
jgi:hypothetical protein